MKKIVFGITSLGIGGAERVLADLANRLSCEYEVTIFMLYGKGEFISQLNSKIKIETLYSSSYQELSNLQKKLIPLKVLFQKKTIYKKYIKSKFDVEIAFLEGPITRIFSVKNKLVRKIAWIHNDMSRVFGQNLKAKIKKILDKKIYAKYNCLVFVSKDNLKQFEKFYGDIRNELLEPVPKRIIHNYINCDNILKKAQEQVEEKLEEETINFLTVARLVEQKGIDRLIKVHSNLLKKGKKHKFYVIGDGPQKEQLEKMIKENKVEDTFILMGKRENPYPYIKMANYFCLLSRYEGYGMVLEEAKILQKPIIITDTAAREAVEGYSNSKIVENTQEKIEQALQEIIDKKTSFKKEDKKDEYNNERIIEKIKKVIEE